jgi:hypothetical protein
LAFTKTETGSVNHQHFGRQRRQPQMHAAKAAKKIAPSDAPTMSGMFSGTGWKVRIVNAALLPTDVMGLAQSASA